LKTEKNNITYKIGDILEVKSFAGPKVYKKVSKIIDKVIEWQSGEITHLKGFEGSFVRRKDLYALKKRCVPYTGREKLSETSSFTFDWCILRVVKKAEKAPAARSRKNNGLP